MTRNHATHDTEDAEDAEDAASTGTVTSPGTGNGNVTSTEPSTPTRSDPGSPGFEIVHEPERQRYAVYQDITDARHDAPQRMLVGEAHYRLIGDDGIDFAHTMVIPNLRGTGLSTTLAHHAVTGDAAAGRRIMASCWFIARYLARHPDLARN